MIKKLLFILLIISGSKSFSQTSYYYYQGSKIPLELSEEKIGVSSIQLKNIQEYKKNNNKIADISIQQETNIVELKFKNKLSDKEYMREMKDLKMKGFSKIYPFYKKSTDNSITTSDIFYIKLKKSSDFNELKKTAKNLKVKILGRNKFMPLWFKLEAGHSGLSSVELTNLFYESNKFDAVDPGFLFDYQPTCKNDDDFGQLWGLQNSANPAIDINACEAWQITEGNNINIAIVDQGIQLDHIDLQDNVSSLSYNSINGASPSQVYGDHGTHVAGTAAAVGDNSNQIVGVAPLATLMSVSHPLTISSTTSEELADGINWAVQNGADVINNSWGDQGGQFFNDLHSTILEDAILNAINEGRNGLGTTVVFAAGNSSPAIDYPANAIPEILTVGSIRNNGVRSNFSGFGNELDVVAPGTGILSTIPTNDTEVLNGTSMAAPHVTGLVALLLSVNNSLTSAEITNIIEQTSQKIGTYGYNINRVNGTWDQEVGYGLVDARAAVNEALNNLTIQGPNEICGGSNFEGVLEVPIDVSNIADIEWIVPSYPTFIRSGQGTTELHFSFFSPGSATIGVNVTLNDSSVIHLETEVQSLPSSNNDNPYIEIAPNNPSNLICCNTSGYYNVDHAILKGGYSVSNDLEWKWDIQSQNSNDIYVFDDNDGTAFFSVQKHTYSPLVVSVKVRTVNECESASDWSNEISRYYGTISNSSFSKTNISKTTDDSGYKEKEFPIENYYLQNSKTLHIQFLNVYEWLDKKYSNKNLTDKDIEKILSILKQPEFVNLQIYDLNANLKFSQAFAYGNHKVNVSKFKPGIYIAKYSIGKNEFSSKFIVK